MPWLPAKVESGPMGEAKQTPALLVLGTHCLWRRVARGVVADKNKRKNYYGSTNPVQQARRLRVDNHLANQRQWNC